MEDYESPNLAKLRHAREELAQVRRASRRARAWDTLVLVVLSALVGGAIVSLMFAVLAR